MEKLAWASTPVLEVGELEVVVDVALMTTWTSDIGDKGHWDKKYCLHAVR